MDQEFITYQEIIDKGITSVRVLLEVVELTGSEELLNEVEKRITRLEKINQWLKTN